MQPVGRHRGSAYFKQGTRTVDDAGPVQIVRTR
jgi:hypothetical protein